MRGEPFTLCKKKMKNHLFYYFGDFLISSKVLVMMSFMGQLGWAVVPSYSNTSLGVAVKGIL